MNKITKLWALALALCVLLVSLYTRAATGDTSKIVSLILNNWNNSCTVLDYQLGTKTVKQTDQQTEDVPHSISCIFLNSSANTISLVMTDLQNSTSNTIGRTNFIWNLTSVTTDWTLNSWSNKSNFNLGTATWVYIKNANTAGVWSWSLSIKWTIPGWTPAWTYTWNLNLTIQS